MESDNRDSSYFCDDTGGYFVFEGGESEAAKRGIEDEGDDNEITDCVNNEGDRVSRSVSVNALHWPRSFRYLNFCVRENT